MLIFCVKQAELLQTLRETRGMSQRDLAVQSKITQATIYRSEGSHTELQPATAVRVLKAMNAQSPFSVEELANIQDVFGISGGIFLRHPATNSVQPAHDPTPAALAAALAGIVGAARATELLRQILTSEAGKIAPPLKHVAEEAGSDGKTYRVTRVDPANAKTAKPGALPRRKSS